MIHPDLLYDHREADCNLRISWFTVCTSSLLDLSSLWQHVRVFEVSRDQRDCQPLSGNNPPNAFCYLKIILLKENSSTCFGCWISPVIPTSRPSTSGTNQVYGYNSQKGPVSLERKHADLMWCNWCNHDATQSAFNSWRQTSEISQTISIGWLIIKGPPIPRVPPFSQMIPSRVPPWYPKCLHPAPPPQGEGVIKKYHQQTFVQIFPTAGKL